MRSSGNIKREYINNESGGIISFILILLSSIATLMLFVAVFLLANMSVLSFVGGGGNVFAPDNRFENLFYIKNGSVYEGFLNDRKVLIRNEFYNTQRITFESGRYYYMPQDNRGVAAYYISDDGSALCIVDKENRLFVNEFKKEQSGARPKMILLLKNEVDIKNKNNIIMTPDGLYVYIRNRNGVLYCYDRENIALNTVDYEVERMELQNGGNGVVYVSNRGIVKNYDLERDRVIPSVMWYEKENTVAYHNDRIYYFYNGVLNEYDLKRAENRICDGILSNVGMLRFAYAKYFDGEMYVYLTRLGKKNVNEVYWVNSGGDLMYVDSEIKSNIYMDGKGGFIYIDGNKLVRNDGQVTGLADNVKTFSVSKDKQRVFYLTRGSELYYIYNGGRYFIASGVDDFAANESGNDLVYLTKKGRSLYYDGLNDEPPIAVIEGVRQFATNKDGRVMLTKRSRGSRKALDLYYFDNIDKEVVIVEQGIKQLLM